MFRQWKQSLLPQSDFKSGCSSYKILSCSKICKGVTAVIVIKWSLLKIFGGKFYFFTDMIFYDKCLRYVGWPLLSLWRPPWFHEVSVTLIDTGISNEPKILKYEAFVETLFEGFVLLGFDFLTLYGFAQNVRT